MMTLKSRLLTKVSCGVAFLALAFTSNISTVQAQTDVPTWMMVDPISTAVKALEERITSLEAKIASMAASQPSNELCIADEAGARTCISKAQLDRLLKMAQTAAIEPPAKTSDRMTSVAESVTEPAKVEPAIEAPVEAAEAMPAPIAPETQAAVVEEPAQIETAPATVVEAPRQAEQAALTEDKVEQDVPTGSIPAPEQPRQNQAQGQAQEQAQVSQPEVEVTTPPTEQ
jgi:hypothetical protein